MPALAPERPPVRHNQTLTPDDLRREAREAVEASGESRSALAARLGVSPGAVSLALNEGREASRYGALLGRIIGLLTDYEVAEVTPPPTFRVTRRAG